MTMHTVVFNFKIFGLCLVTCLCVNAEVPITPQFKNYAHLLKISPFEIKINQMVEQIDQPQVRTDYFLRGLSKLEKGWMIVIVDRKKPKVNIIIKQGEKSSAEIELVNVIQNKEDYKLTTATLKVSNQEMTIGYNKAELDSAFQQQTNTPVANSPQTTENQTNHTQSQATKNPPVNASEKKEPTVPEP